MFSRRSSSNVISNDSRYSLEGLEARRLLSAIVITGDIGDDLFQVSYTSTQVMISDTNVNGTKNYTYSLASAADGIHIYGYSIRPGTVDSGSPGKFIDWDGDLYDSEDGLYGADELDVDIHNVDSVPGIIFDTGDPSDHLGNVSDGGFDQLKIDDAGHSSGRDWMLNAGAQSNSGETTSNIVVDAPVGNGVLNAETLLTGSGPDSVDLETGTIATSLSTGAGNDTITQSYEADDIAIDTGSDPDLVTIMPNFNGTILTGTGNDTINLDSREYDEDGTLYATVTGGSGDDQINVGTNNGTLYGIRYVSLPGTGGGNDTLTVDDSNYDSDHSYRDTSVADSGNDYYSTNGEIATTSLGIYGYQTGILYGANVLVKLHMQSENETGTNSVHPTFHAQNVSSGGFILYPGSVPNAAHNGYLYDDITVDTADFTSMHVAPSEGLDHYTIGNGSGTKGYGQSGADVTFDGTGTSSAPPPIGPLDIKSDGFVTVAVGAGKALKMSSLTIASGGQLDLTNSSAIIDYSGSSSLLGGGGILSYIVSGFASGNWNGSGIVSSNAQAAADPDGLTAVGNAENSDLSLSSFGGQSVDSSAILLRYTYYGDADLNGEVDLDDYNQFLYGYEGHDYSPPTRINPQNWLNGDFDYSGYVDLDDLNLWQANY